MLIVFYLHLLLIFLYDLNGRLSIDFGRVVGNFTLFLAGPIAKMLHKSPCLGLATVGSDAVPRAVSKTGLGSAVGPLDAEFYATA